MDVLSPQLMWINNRCYRINNTMSAVSRSETAPSNEYIEEDLYDGEEPDEYIVELNENNKFSTSFHVPQVFFAQIIGSKGATLKRLEAETKTQINVPKPNVEGNIVITGITRKQVVTCRRRIEIIVIAGRNKLQPTHFLSIPIRNAEIKSNFNKFRDAILFDKTIYDIGSFFQEPNKLHITICTLALMDNEDRTLASQLLQECKSTIIDPIRREYKEMIVKISEVQYMNDDPTAVNVLYAGVECEPLQKMANQIADYFANHGMRMANKYENVKLHCTLINSRHGNKEEGESYNKNKKSQRKTFDACKILRKYDNLFFGSQPLSEIHLSQRFSTACDRYYEATAIVKI